MRKLTLVFGVSVLLAGFAPALHAQTTPPPVDAGKGVMDEATPAAAKAKPKKMNKTAKIAKSIIVKITNTRVAAVSSLTFTPAGIADGGKSLTKPLAAGKKATLKLDTKKGCTFDVRGSFDDDVAIEADSIDFCADPTLVLTE